MDPLRRQLRRRLELEQMLGAAALPRLDRVRGGEPAGTAARPADDPTVRQLALLDEQVRACTRCELCQGRQNTVFGEGDPHAAVVFVGEAPGQDEDIQGRPFVGRAGQLLNDIITKGMGLRREDVYIANVCKCRPPGNRTPTPAEMAECLPYLLRQLELIRPAVIVALGATAAQGLLVTREPVGQLRGRVHELTLDPLSGQTTPVVVTYHPAYVLRNYSPDTRGKVWQDIQVAMEIAGIPNPKKK